MTSHIQLLNNLISSVLKPLVVTAGVPSLTPEVTNGDLGSFGTAFLLTVIFTSPNAFSKSFPVISLFRKSTRTI